ncbi:hypothetical protein J6590_041838 [Homalodisca vitripennis]|nr:hypothetical protein J6590_041838 [Homalodisca vitripennis]
MMPRSSGNIKASPVTKPEDKQSQVVEYKADPVFVLQTRDNPTWPFTPTPFRSNMTYQPLRYRSAGGLPMLRAGESDPTVLQLTGQVGLLQPDLIGAIAGPHGHSPPSTYSPSVCIEIVTSITYTRLTDM